MGSEFWRGGHLVFTCDGVPAALCQGDAEKSKKKENLGGHCCTYPVRSFTQSILIPTVRVF